jgi:hypothetical protein
MELKMSTRSRIGMIYPNGEIKSIYCHFDGYFRGVGATLLEHYTTFDKVNELIELGDISALKNTTDETISYYRDFKESFENTRPMINYSKYHFISSATQSGAEYYYLFDGASWISCML